MGHVFIRCLLSAVDHSPRRTSATPSFASYGTENVHHVVVDLDTEIFRPAHPPAFATLKSRARVIPRCCLSLRVSHPDERTVRPSRHWLMACSVNVQCLDCHSLAPRCCR